MPIYITAHVVEHGDDTNYARFLKFRTTDGKWRFWVMPMAMLFDSQQELCSALAARGFVIVPKHKDAFIEYLATQIVRNNLICTSQVGWSVCSDCCACVSELDGI